MNTYESTPKGYGFDTGDMFKPCTVSGCQNCFASYLDACATTTRPTCNPATELMKIDYTLKTAACVTSATITDYGKVTVAGTAKYWTKCLYPGCTDCTADYKVCSACATSPAAYYALPHDSKACYTTEANVGTNLPGLGVGWKVTDPTTTPPTGTIAQCADPNCLSCAADYSVCTACNDFSVMIGRKCIHVMAIPSTHIGKIISPTSITPGASCGDAKCKVCSNAMTCLVCLTKADGESSDYYPNSSGSSCVLDSALQPGFGPLVGMGLSKVCASKECSSCTTDFRFCEACQATDVFSKNLYFIKEWGLCTNADPATLAGWGPDANAGNPTHLYPCSTAGGLYCRTDYQVDETTVTPTTTCTGDDDCSNCDTAAPANSCNSCTTAGNYLNIFKRGGCQPLAGSGFNAITVNGAKLMMPCKTPGCSACGTDIAVCTACEYPYNLVGGKCVAYVPTGTKTGWKTDRSGLAACPSGCDNCYMNNNVCDNICTSADCLQCPSAPATCTLCFPETTASLQTYLDVNVCTLKANLVQKGVDKTKINTAGDCKYKDGCADCLDDLTKCVTCSPTYFMGDDGATPTAIPQCQSDTGTYKFPTSKGPNLTSKVVQKCNDPGLGCTTCKADYLKCTDCNLAGGYYFHVDTTDATKSTCYHKTLTTMFPDKIGPKSDGKAVPCDDANCKTCNDDYLTCKDCLASYYLHTDSKCYTTTSKATMPAYFGPATSGTPLKTLACVAGTPNCVDCHDDTTKCYECDSSMLADMGTPGCLTSTAFNAKAKYGVVPSTSGKQVNACTDTNCADCRADNTVCVSCDANYFLHPTDKKCYDDAGIPNKFGKVVPATGTPTNLATCDLANCKICKDDKTICTECDATFTLKIDASNVGTCETGTAPNGFGKDTGLTPATWKPCLTSQNCLTCVADYTKCETCNPTEVLQITTKKCFASTAIPAGFGRDLTTTTGQEDIIACADATECNKCEADNTKCTECKTKYVLISDGVCYASGSFPSKTGIVPPTAPSTLLKIDACTVTNCDNCATDYQKCDVCNTSFKYRDTANNKCTATITAGLGLVASAVNFEIKACTDTNCGDCATLNTQCNGCKTGIYLDGTACTSTIPDGKGVDTSLTILTLAPCANTNCLKCPTNKDLCEECKPTFSLKFDDKTCTATGTPVAKFGKDTAATIATVKPCADTNCDLCTDNYQICTQCNNLSLLVPDTGKCYLLTDTFPPRYGKKVVSGQPTTLVLCKDLRCSDCLASYDTCTACDAGFSLQSTGACTVSKINVVPLIPVFDKAPNTFAFSFPGKKITKNILENLYVYLKTAEGKIYEDQTKFSLSTVPNGIAATIKVTEEYGQSELIVDRLDRHLPRTTARILAASLTPEEQATMDSMAFPFQGPVITNYKSSSIDSLKSFDVYTKIGVALRIITNILLPYDIFSRVSAFVIDRMFSHLTLASVQGSYKYVMSRMGLRYVQFGRRTVLPFLNLDVNRESADCNPTNAMLIAGEHCDYLVNYGDNAMGLAIILGFMIIIDVLYMFLHSKLSCSPVKSFHFFIYITLKTFGVRFFVAKMEAVSMEVVFHFFTNAYTLKTFNVGGFILGIIMTIYILAQIGLCIWIAKTLAPLAEDQRYNVRSDTDIIEMKHGKQPDHRYLWRVMSMMWVGMRAHVGKHAVYYPIVSMIRMFLLGLIVGIFTEVIVAMSVLVIIVEGLFIGYAVFFTRLRPRISLIDNIIEFIGPCFNIVYHFFSAISTSDSLERKGGYDTYLYIILLIFILANLVLAVVALLFAALRLARWYRQSDKIYSGDHMNKAAILSDNNKKADQVHGTGAYVPPGMMNEAKQNEPSKIQMGGYQTIPLRPNNDQAVGGVLQTEQGHDYGAPLQTLPQETITHQHDHPAPTHPTNTAHEQSPLNPAQSAQLAQPGNPTN
jgi:hypothetical protein